MLTFFKGMAEKGGQFSTMFVGTRQLSSHKGQYFILAAPCGVPFSMTTP